MQCIIIKFFSKEENKSNKSKIRIKENTMQSPIVNYIGDLIVLLPLSVISYSLFWFFGEGYYNFNLIIVGYLISFVTLYFLFFFRTKSLNNELELFIENIFEGVIKERKEEIKIREINKEKYLSYKSKDIVYFEGENLVIVKDAVLCFEKDKNILKEKIGFMVEAFESNFITAAEVMVNSLTKGELDEIRTIAMKLELTHDIFNQSNMNISDIEEFISEFEIQILEASSFTNRYIKRMSSNW